MSNNATNLMIDLETLGTRVGSVILSIAAVPFATPYPVEYFYEKIDEGSCLDSNFTIDEPTVNWWKKQSKEAYYEAFSGTTSIRDTLEMFSDYCKACGSVIVWGNGSDFDIALLAEAYRKLAIPIPWSYKNVRCYRTLKALAPAIPYFAPEVKHNALQDAKAQAQHAQHIMKWMMRGVT